MGLGSWRLDRPHAVSARKEEAEVLREVWSPGSWHQHHVGSAVMTAIDRRSRTMRRLGGNVVCQRSVGEAAGEGMRRQLTEAWMEHLGTGRGWNFTSGSAAPTSIGGLARRWCLSASTHEMIARGNGGCDGHRCVMKNATHVRLSDGNLAGDDRRCHSRGRGWVWEDTGCRSGSGA
jgi:hypothetical protein